MKEFSSSKNGYNKDDVKAYVEEMEQKLQLRDQEIAKLQNELIRFKEQENELKQKSETISIALTAAVEKAKQIEKSSQNIYNLKIQELDVLYKRWEKVLNELIEKYPRLDEIDNVKRLMVDFKNSIKASIKEDFRFINQPKANIESSDPMRALLSKINQYLDKQVEQNAVPKIKPRIRHQLPKDMQQKQSELNKLEEKSAMIKPIYQSKIAEGEKYDSLLDKFLSEEATLDSAYANKITKHEKLQKNETGFDLKEAINPKEDLEEIMKSFDFFNN